MSATTQPEPLETQQTGVSVDFRDLNYTHFLGDLETQAPNRPFLSKKARWITAASVILVLCTVTAILVGGKLGMSSVKKRVPSPIYSTVSAETQTVYMTTLDISRTVLTHSATPNATTITTATITTPSFASFEAPLPASTLVNGPDGTGRHNGKCFTKGDFNHMSECEEKCSSISSGPETSVKCLEQFFFKRTFKCTVCRNT